MNSLTRYVLRQLVVGMILVTTGLTCIIWLTQSLRFVEMIVNRGLSAGTFLYLSGLLLPNFLIVILPIALFTVVVFIYAKLITDRELVVMRAAGLSQFALAKPALILTGLTVLLSYALHLQLVPESYRAFRDLQWDIRNSVSHVLLKEGEFNNVGSTTTVYVRTRTPDGQLHGILVHDTRDRTKPFTLMADRGAMVDTPTGPRVVMFKGNRQEVDKTTNKLSILYFDRWVYNLALGGPQGVRWREPRERTLNELFDTPNQIDQIGAQNIGKFVVEAHRRLIAPVLCLAYAMIGLSSLLTGNFGRRTQTARVLIAVAAMVVLQAVILGMENMVAKNLDLIPLLYAVILAPMPVAWFVMVRPPSAAPTAAKAA
ncbi:MAG: LPS export ABC transporter permease LptF [Rhodospirillales bacterium CG15_BIG_FIL_POST_REV_8_21_14_020_66_15]|nr:MAG: LPS export ABC transporter permease LptF [Rhodospirillales bacterium CG15_BIG_FIL_POST_REV_8_21_14_020_66_15]